MEPNADRTGEDAGGTSADLSQARPSDERYVTLILRLRLRGLDDLRQGEILNSDTGCGHHFREWEELLMKVYVVLNDEGQCAVATEPEESVGDDAAPPQIRRGLE